MVRLIGPSFAFALLPVFAAAQAPVFRSGVSIIEVPLVAKNADQSPVRDLKKTDLRLSDNGVGQTILSLDKLAEVVESAGQPRERLSVIVLDSLNTDWQTQFYARKAVVEMLETLVHGTDRIAIFALGDQLRVLHDFSDDSVVLRAAVERYAGELPASGVYNSAGASDGNAPPPPPPPAPVPNRPDPRVPVAAPPLGRGSLEADRRADRLLLTLDALRTIAHMMKPAPGQKNLLWITAGFPPPARHDAIQRVMSDLADAKLTLYPIDARGVLPGLKSHVEAGSLVELAEQTGGRVYSNSNATSVFLRAALDDSRDGYLLTFTPRNYVPDGSLHQLRLITSRKNVGLRYRPAYLADRTP